MTQQRRRGTASNRSTLPRPSPEWAYFLDFDGTLVDLAPTPSGVRADDALAILRHVSDMSGAAVAIISGRAMADLDAMFGAHVFPTAGQHGVERRTANGVVVKPASDRRDLDDVREWLRRAIQVHPGLLLEDKGYSLALHYRLIPQLAGFAHRTMRAASRRLGGAYEVQPGHRVIELKLAAVHKGDAILAFMQESPFLARRPVFVGDDLTDEVGFEAVNALGGLSVKVGRGRTAAHWSLPDVRAVRQWLFDAFITTG